MENSEKYDHLPYNQRQFCHMSDAIRAYFDHSISLYELKNTLTGLLYALETMPDDWMGQFEMLLNTIEDDYVVKRAMQVPVTDDDIHLIHQAIYQMNDMISLFLPDKE